MLKDIDQILNEYFPEKWGTESISKLSGDPRFTRDAEAINGALNVPLRDFLLRGGKRIRPILFLTLIKIFGKDPKQYLDLALFIELIHNGTLVIDDIEDDSELRRGEPTLHKKYGMDIAVNTGVAMHVLPLSILLKEHDQIPDQKRLRIFEIYSEEIINLYLGQATDISWHKNSPSNITVDKYLEMCRLKTGSLMRVSVKMACALTDQNSDTESALTLFAESAGIAFQIKDDVLDLTADEKEFGKSFGNDITEGKLSLPVILALSELNDSEKERLLHILQMHTHDESLLHEARALIMQTKVIDQALHKAETLFDEAWQQVEKNITDPESRQVLQDLTHSFIKRDK